MKQDDGACFHSFTYKQEKIMRRSFMLTHLIASALISMVSSSSINMTLAGKVERTQFRSFEKRKSRRIKNNSNQRPHRIKRGCRHK